MNTSEKEDVILIVLGLAGAILLAAAILWVANEIRASATITAIEVTQEKVQ